MLEDKVMEIYDELDLEIIEFKSADIIICSDEGNINTPWVG